MWLHCETNGRIVVLLYINIDDFDILKWLISLVNLNVLDGMDDFKPSNCPAKDGMLAVQPGSRSRGNKPLGTVAVCLAWIRHGHRVWAGRSETLVPRDERTGGHNGRRERKGRTDRASNPDGTHLRNRPPKSIRRPCHLPTDHQFGSSTARNHAYKSPDISPPIHTLTNAEENDSQTLQ